MTISLPSKEIYSVDVPEVNDLAATFRYNFFTPDESVSETGGVPVKVLQRQSDEVDAAFIQYATTRAPRLVSFSFKLPRLVESSNVTSDATGRANVFESNAQNGSLISDNIDKVVTEDHFASNNYVAVNFNDGEIDDKVHYLVSGSHTLNTYNDDSDNNTSDYKAAHRLSSLTPKHIKPHFLFRSLAQPAKNGVRFFGKGGMRIFNTYFKRLKQVTTNAQINSKLFNEVVNRTINDPHSPFTSDLQNIQKFAKKLKHQSMQKMSSQVSESDFKTFTPFISVKVRRTAHHKDQNGAEIVGYIIDKVEVRADGTSRSLSPIIIDNPRVNSTADFQVKYNTTYVYSVRTVVQFTLPAIDDDTGEIAMIKILVSSKPSNKVHVNTIETTAPPCPADVNFTWDYDRVNPITAQYDHSTGQALPGTGKQGSLMIHWTFPPNSQRDIKKFQVFRRRSVDHPFEMIKMYDFDDSVVRLPDKERPDQSLVEHITSPCTFFYDDDFLVGDQNAFDNGEYSSVGSERHPGSSTFIYTVAAIDAHGYTSNFGAQFEVWFDLFKNQLQKKLISHCGAPKPYPNLYLEADTFVDTIRVSGPHSKQVRVYFNPEYYHLYDDQERLTRVLATRQTGGSYKMQFINTDNQKSAAVNITINDQVRAASKTLAFPEVRFGPKRKGRLQIPTGH